MDQHANIGIDILERGGAVVVVIEGEVDLYSAEEFERCLAAARASSAPRVVIDLERVSFMDSAGVHVLLQFAIARRARGRLAVTPGSHQVQRLLEATGVRRYLSVVPSSAPESITATRSPG